MSEPLELPEFVNNIFTVEIEPKPEKPPEQRIFELECEVSMLHEFVTQIVEELREQGITVSTKLKEDFADCE